VKLPGVSEACLLCILGVQKGIKVLEEAGAVFLKA